MKDFFLRDLSYFAKKRTAPYICFVQWKTMQSREKLNILSLYPSRRSNFEKFFDDMRIVATCWRQPKSNLRLKLNWSCLDDKWIVFTESLSVVMCAVWSVYAGQFRCTIETVCTDQDNDLLRAFQDIDTFYCSIFNGFRFTEKQVPMTHRCNLKNYDCRHRLTIVDSFSLLQI